MSRNTSRGAVQRQFRGRRGRREDIPAHDISLEVLIQRACQIAVKKYIKWFTGGEWSSGEYTIEDLENECFIACIMASDKIRAARNPGGYAYTVCVNRLKAFFKQEFPWKYRDLISGDGEDNEETWRGDFYQAEKHDDNETEFKRKWLSALKALPKALGCLEPNELTVVRLHYDNPPATLKTISRVLEISTSTAGRIHSAALSKLRRKLGVLEPPKKRKMRVRVEEEPALEVSAEAI